MVNYSNINEYGKFNGHRRFCKQFLTLKGIIKGIESDGEINDKEISELTSWCVDNREFQRYQPFRDLIPLITAACEDYILSEEEIADIIWVAETFERDDIVGSIETQMMQQLHGIIHGMLADGVLNDQEIYALQDWINDNDFLKGTYPYDEIESIILGILSDNIITENERNTLIASMADFVDADISSSLSREKFEQIKHDYSIVGICAVDPQIIFPNKLFCFTGESSRGTRKDIADIISVHGGKFHDRVLKETDYLIVGNEGSPCWAYSCYGRKVEAAHKIRKNGGKIIIANEVDLWDALI